jgi:hypothetical protein
LFDLHIRRSPATHQAKHGPVAQLVERTIRIRKIRGSIPLRSTSDKVSDFFNFSSIKSHFTFYNSRYNTGQMSNFLERLGQSFPIPGSPRSNYDELKTQRRLGQVFEKAAGQDARLIKIVELKNLNQSKIPSFLLPKVKNVQLERIYLHRNRSEWVYSDQTVARLMISGSENFLRMAVVGPSSAQLTQSRQEWEAPPHENIPLNHLPDVENTWKVTPQEVEEILSFLDSPR